MIRLRAASVCGFLWRFGGMMSSAPKQHHAEAPAETQRQKRGEGGFTLLEVIISLAILVLGLSAILPLFAVGASSHRRGIDQTMVSLIAPHITARLQERLYELNPPALKDQEYAEVGRIYKYDATFTPLDPYDTMKLAFIVHVTVRWSENMSLHSEAFSTILLRRTQR
jgi:prepilin-type N-terminal cleavage/methylation domain-containing protein